MRQTIVHGDYSESYKNKQKDENQSPYFVLSTFSLFTSLLNYEPYVPSCLTCLRALHALATSCLRALRALTFTRLNYAPWAPYFCALLMRLSLRWGLLLKAVLKCSKRELNTSSVWNLNEKTFWLRLLILINIIIYIHPKSIFICACYCYICHY